MTAPKVSIILPVYNGERFLSQAIESCLAQSLSDWELIIVDDGSTDRTAEIIAHYVRTDRRIYSCRHEKNKNLPAALNTGFAKARGRLLTWTSDDNLFHPEALEVLTDYLGAHPAVDIVYADCTFIDEQGAVVGERPALPFEDLLITNGIGACFLYWHKVHQQLGPYREDRFLAEDYDFWLRASHCFKFSSLHRKLYYYRSHDKSLSVTRRAEIFLTHEKIFLENIGKVSWCDRRVKSNACIKMALMARDRGFRAKALSYVVRAFCLAPLNVLHKGCRPLLRF